MRKRGTGRERKQVSVGGKKGKSDGAKEETEMELSSRPFTTIISL